LDGCGWHVDFELVAKLVERVKVVLGRFGHQGFDAHRLGELELFPVVAADAELTSLTPESPSFFRTVLRSRRSCRSIGADSFC